MTESEKRQSPAAEIIATLARAGWDLRGYEEELTPRLQQADPGIPPILPGEFHISSENRPDLELAGRISKAHLNQETEIIKTYTFAGHRALLQGMQKKTLTLEFIPMANFDMATLLPGATFRFLAAASDSLIVKGVGFAKKLETAYPWSEIHLEIRLLNMELLTSVANSR